MPTLAPNMQFDVVAENPVNKPSALKALSGLVEAGFEVAESLIDVDPNLEQGLVNGLNRAQQLREQGDTQGALAMERRVMTNYAVAGGDTGKQGVQDLIRNVTGRPAESVGFSQQEMLAQEVMDPDSEIGKAYNRSLLAAQGMLPDGATDEDKHELAMSLIVKEEANAMLIEEAKFNWTNATRGAVLDQISGFGNVTLGALRNVAEKGGTLKLEDVQAVRSQFNQLKTVIAAGKPDNISSDQWKDIQDALTAKEEQIKYFEELAGPGNLDARASAELMRAIEASGIDSFDANIMTRVVKEEPSAFLGRGVLSNGKFNKSMEDVMEYMQEPQGGGLSDGDTRSPAAWDSSVMQGSDGQPLTVEEGLKYAQASSTVMSAITPQQLASNPALRNEYGKAAVRQLSALMGITEQGRFLSGPDLAKFFDNDFYNSLQVLGQVDKPLHDAIVDRSERVLASLQGVFGQKFAVIGEGKPWEYNVRTGEFRVSQEKLATLLPPHVLQRLDRGIDQAYGGDWDAAMADNGRGLSVDAWNAWRTFAGTTGAVPTELMNMGKAYNSVVTHLEKLTGMEAQINQSAFGSDTALMKMMDQTEGGGDYDTLFGHSQRANGQFAGIRPSTMTIGELKQFTDPSGQYGQWVKANNPKNVVATPLGRYQFVGRTLTALAERMGLGDDVVFTPAVQDAMFHFHVQELLIGKPTSEWAGILKGTWDGFNKKTDEEVLRAAAEFMGTPPPALTYTTRSSTGQFGTATATAPTSTKAPPARPQVDIEGPEVVTGEVAEVQEAQQDQEIERGTASKAATRATDEQVILRIMERFNVDEETARAILEAES